MITTPPHRNEGRAKLMRLLDAAIRAPSGDNCQPWSFHLEGETRISIHTVPERAKSFFDYENCATSLSVGAVIENMRVQAASEGGKLQVQYPTGMGISQPITTVELLPDPGIKVLPEVQAAMYKRTVNRRPFLPWPLHHEKQAQLCADPIERTGIQVVSRRKDIARWASIIELGDRIRFSHPLIHEELFSKLLFDRRSAHRIRIGLEADRLGIGPLAVPLLKFLRPWQRVTELSRWGLIGLLAGQSRLLALSSGALMVVTIPTTDAADWIRAGEQVERIWIRAQKLGLAVHPITVALYLDLRYQREGMKNFLPQHRTLLQSLRKRLAELLPAGFGAMLFRVGYGLKMRHTAVRLPIETFLNSEGI